MVYRVCLVHMKAICIFILYIWCMDSPCEDLRILQFKKGIVSKKYTLVFGTLYRVLNIECD